MNRENRIIENGKAELKSLQWFTLYSISNEEILKASGFKICYAIHFKSKCVPLNSILIL
jgi:hypothetical protein